MSASARNGAKSLASSSSSGVSTTGRSQVAVGAGAAVAGDVLDHRQHAAGHAGPSTAARPSADDLAALPAVGAVADDVVAPGRGTSTHRRAVGVEAERRQVVGDQPVIVQPHRLDGGLRIAVAESPNRAAGRRRGASGGRRRATRPPSWSTKTGASSSAGRLAQGCRSSARTWSRRLDVAGEEDEAPRLPGRGRAPARQATERVARAAQDAGGASPWTKQPLSGGLPACRRRPRRRRRGWRSR